MSFIVRTFFILAFLTSCTFELDIFEPFNLQKIKVNGPEMIQEGEQLTFTFDLPESSQDLTIDYKVSHITTSNNDFSGSNLQDTLTLEEDQTTLTLSLDITDDTQFENNETFLIRFDFNHSDARESFQISKTITVLNINPKPQITVSDLTLNENSGVTSVSLSITGQSQEDIFFNLQATSLSATSGNDFSPLNENITLSAGTTNHNVNIQVLDDSIDENDETFTFTISNEQNLDLTTFIPPTFTITDDDLPPNLSVADLSITEGHTENLVLTLSHTSGKSIVINYTMTAGSALAGSDFNDTSNSLTLSPGATSYTLPVVTLQDALSEGNENFTIDLSGGGGHVNITDSQASITIVDDDTIPTISNITSLAGPLRFKQTATFTVVFSESVDVTGVPTLPLTFDSSHLSPEATYVSGSGSSNLIFEYTIRAGDTDADGPVYPAALNLNGGTIQSTAHSITADLSISGISSSTVINSTFVYVNIDKPSSIMNENGGTTSFKVQLSEAAYEPVSVTYYLGGNAIKDTDYTMSSANIDFSIGEQEKTIHLTGIDNANDTSIKVMNLNLIQPDNAKLATESKIDIRINDDEGDLNFKEIASGEDHTCGINTSDQIMCWGKNQNGQLGDGTTEDKNVPVIIDFTNTYKEVSTGNGHTCAITNSDVLKCWGNNFLSQLGTGNTINSSVPITIDSGVSYKNVSAGANHTCALTTADQLKCWGHNSSGQLGDNTTTTRSLPTTIGASLYNSIYSGSDHTCGITTTNALYCWGDNFSGQLGDGTTTPRLVPTLINSGVSYSSASAGYQHSCAITTGNALQCWGTNFQNQLGDGTTTQRLTPTNIDSGNNFSTVSAGNYHSCAITTANKMKCWGVNFGGEVGNGGIGLVTTPELIDNDSNYNKVAIGSSHSCAITSSNELKCWGGNSFGLMGDSTSTSVREPASIEHGLNYTKIASGSYHSCGVDSLGKVRCWGRNSYNQLGDGTLINKNYPTPIESDRLFKDLSANSDQTCAISTTDELLCWGDNYTGQLGDGTTTQIVLPKVIDPGVTYKSISNGSIHTCGITTSNVLKCWGANFNGRLGDGTTTTRHTPTVIDSGVFYKWVSAGGGSTCGITTTDVLKCWGTNTTSQLGDGTTTHRHTPVVIDSGVSYDLVELGSSHACAITAVTNKVKCWGNNSHGKLGDGTTATKSTPTSIDLATSYTSINLGDIFSCGITTGNKIKCWGNNGSGQVGNLSSSDQTTPVTINNSVNYSNIALGNDHACALTTANELNCWGSDSYGEAGGRGHFIHYPGHHNVLSISDVSINESNASVTFTITLNQALIDKTVSFHWETFDGTATAGADYISSTGSETLLPGETSKIVTINLPADDAINEANETFDLRILSSNNAGPIDSTGTATIIDND